MNKTLFTFLRSVLGNDGALAMRRAVAKNPAIENYLIPRTVLGWSLTKKTYEGTVPGTDVFVSFSKSEDGFSGSIATSTNPAQDFNSINEYALAAEILSALKFDVKKFEGTDRDLSTLGKSVDALIKARALTKQLEKGAVDLPGQTHKPTKQQGPEAPEAPQKQPAMGQKPKLPKLPFLKVEKKDLKKTCKLCEQAFFKNNEFVGCVCWKDLAKTAVETVYSDGVVVEFRGADKAAVATFYKEFNNG